MGSMEPRTASTTDRPRWDPPLPSAAGFEHRIVETPGLRTHLAEIGDGDPVLLLHGFPQHWWQWRDVAPRLATRYRVLCPDLRGQGGTSADDPRVRRTTRMRDLLALLDVLGTGPVHVVSHDLGALTAMQLAYAHPERVRAMVHLSVPPGFITFSPAIAPGFRHLPSFLLHRPGRSLRWILSGDYLATPLPAETIDAHLLPLSRPEIDRAVRPLCWGMVPPEVLRLAGGTYKRKRLRPPTLVVFGRQDAPWSEQVLRRIVGDPDRHADRLELAFIDGAAHFVTDDAPEAVADLALDWFERTAGEAT